MENEAPTIAEIVQQLPQKLQLRFNSLGSFVHGMIDEISAEGGKPVLLSRDDIQLIQLAAFIYTLGTFFRAGTHAARSAATLFEQFGMSGFQIGTTDFTQYNRNTRRGELLADDLMQSLLRTPLAEIIMSAQTMKQLISTMIEEMTNEQAVDE